MIQKNNAMKKNNTARDILMSKVRNYPNNNEQAKKSPTFRHSKNSRGMKLLWHPSTVIQTGKYAGMTFGYVLEHYGKSAFPELLKYYRICSTVMNDYHCTLKPHKEESKETASAKDQTSVSMTNQAPVVDNANVTNQVDKVVDRGNNFNSTDRGDEYDKWTMSRSDYENGVLYDPEDDVPDIYNDDLLMGGVMGNHYAGGDKWRREATDD